MYRVSDTQPVAAALSPDSFTCAAVASGPATAADMFEPTLRARLPAVLFELLALSVEFTFRVLPSTCSLALQAHVARVLQHWAALAEGATSQTWLPQFRVRTKPSTRTLRYHSVPPSPPAATAISK